MSKSFLHYVAKDLLGRYGNNLSEVSVVFPGNRASLFLNQELQSLSHGDVILSPSYLSIAELFAYCYPYDVADEEVLVAELYNVYVEKTHSTETFDHFYEWGRVLLSDFDDVDKNLGEASLIFANVKDLHSFDDVDYLEEHQVKALKSFFSSFSDDHSSLLRAKFLNLWSKLYDIYCEFRKVLRSKGLAYEGMMYRDVAEDDNLKLGYDHYVFVGFNMIQHSEMNLMKRMKREGKALFYWDFDEAYIGASNGVTPNEAGLFVWDNIKKLGSALPIDSEDIYNRLNEQKDITFIRTTTENVQARFVSQWLTDERMAAGNRTAIVLADEHLLKAVCHSLPDTISEPNVTMGMPLSDAPVVNFCFVLLDLYFKGRLNGGQSFRSRIAMNVLRNQFCIMLSPHVHELIEKIQHERIYYLTVSDIVEDDGLSLIFNGVSEKGNETIAIVDWLLRIVRHLSFASQVNHSRDMMMQESIYELHQVLSHLYDLLSDGVLTIDKITLTSLLRRMVGCRAIPFHGEPATGVQIMGVLETRCIDFDNVLLLSANEGNLPKSLSDTSFIPMSVKKSFSLTTADKKVSIYAYYFQHLLQRAKHVTILYCDSPDNGHSADMSRFMLQMLVERRHNPVKRMVLTGRNSLEQTEKRIIEKTPEMIESLLSKTYLSPSAFNTYIACQKQFYYQQVLGLRESDELDEKIDSRIFGVVFHNAVQLLYDELSRSGKLMTEDKLRRVLDDEILIRKCVDKAMEENLLGKAAGRTFSGIEHISREIFVYYLRKLLSSDLLSTPFVVHQHEKEVVETFTFTSDDGVDMKIKIGGIIDRIDEMILSPMEASVLELPHNDNGTSLLRIVDYKTGGNHSKVLNTIEQMFEHDSKRTYAYYLQTCLYSIIIKRMLARGESFDKGSEAPHDVNAGNDTNRAVAPVLLYLQELSTKIKNTKTDPIVKFNKKPLADIAKVTDEYLLHLNTLLTEIFSLQTPFSPCNDSSICSKCPFASMC